MKKKSVITAYKINIHCFFISFSCSNVLFMPIAGHFYISKKILLPNHNRAVHMKYFSFHNPFFPDSILSCFLWGNHEGYPYCAVSGKLVFCMLTNSMYGFQYKTTIPDNSHRCDIWQPCKRFPF
uniref:Uncharacterized protein n=1 Tax=Kuenenia stuttgartiensis TaxID=174633 RepID=Q1Q327_KUEST|nr:unknown protein [Candidatus Kuenenia stuttgartiensis]